MSMNIDLLEAEVLSRPESERSRLVDRLLASLERDPEWERAWSDEADVREAAIQNGTAAWVSGPEAVARMRATLE